ncbi:MAG: hypothetical protein FWH57_10100 [Oscillospiraceae bacterium]|nr:hypothetical protein [Oscillospiraceae bacterium]
MKKKRSNDSKGIIAWGIIIILVFSCLSIYIIDKLDYIPTEDHFLTVLLGVVLPLTIGIGFFVHGIRYDRKRKKVRVFYLDLDPKAVVCFFVVIVFVGWIGSMFYLGFKEGNGLSLALASAIVYVIVDACVKNHKDTKENIFRVSSSYDMRKKIGKEMSIKSKYTNPNCKECQDELREFENRVRYGHRE